MKFKTFDEYVEESKEAFEEVLTEDMVSTKLRKFYNQEEFRILLKYLREKYGSSLNDWMVHDGGGKYFYYLYNDSGLKEAIGLKEDLIKRFEKIKNFKVIPFQNLFPDITTDKPIFIKLTKQQSAEMENLINDINIYKYQLTWIYTILFFNRAKKELIDFTTNDFKLHYEKNGYIDDIKKDMSNNAKGMIFNMIDMIPDFVAEIGTLSFLIAGKKIYKNDINELKRILKLKMDSLDKLILLVEKNKYILSDNMTKEIHDYKDFRSNSDSEKSDSENSD